MGTGIRPTGIDNAAAALRYWERRQEVVANNLANVSTDGFKGERAFARLLGDGSTPAIDSSTDYRAGPMNSTGNPLDLAITGDGFFVVQTPRGERLTRGGSLSLNDQHQVVDASGNLVLGEDDPAGGVRGPVVLPDHAANVQVDAGGAVRVDGRQVARLRVERAAPGAKLNHEGGGLFETALARPSVPFDQRTVRQGMREESNVNSIESMVDMLSIQRAYASVQKVLTTIDTARGIATTELGKPA
jgi:flagellar basal-body rod protein FlgF